MSITPPVATVIPLQTALHTRRSVRRFAPTPVHPALLETLLHAAAAAPSAHNRQPWRFVVLTTDDAKLRLAAAMGARLHADRTADGDLPDVVAADVARSQGRIAQAPALVLLCVTMADMDTYPDARRAQHERTMAVQSVAMAGQNLLLAAHDAGLGACWMCAPLFCADVARDALHLPGDWEPQALIALGYPSESRARGRAPLESRVLWR